MSFGQFSSPMAFSPGTPFTILFYFKYTHMPRSRQICLFLFESPVGALTSTSFFMDDDTGKIWYYPDNVAISHTGSLFNNNPTVDWIPVKISYSGGMMGTASFDDVPVLSTSVSIVTSAVMYLGYRDDLDRVSDFGIACLGFYNEVYSDGLAERHGKSCSNSASMLCPVAPGPYANAVQSGTIASADVKILYMCRNGYTWSGINSLEQSIKCVQTTGSMLPTLYFDPSIPTGTCTGKQIKK